MGATCRNLEHVSSEKWVYFRSMLWGRIRDPLGQTSNPPDDHSLRVICFRNEHGTRADLLFGGNDCQATYFVNVPYRTEDRWDEPSRFKANKDAY
jgi:hypothetical protein